MGSDRSIGEIGQTIAERAAGNPFFAEEIVRELAERGVLHGKPGAYVSTADVAEVSVPATLQTTIAARIDRLDLKAKRTLSAASVIGSRFGLDLVNALGVEPAVTDLMAAQLIDQVRFTRKPEFVFRNPVIRAVAYESQLRSDRAELHRRLAAAIEARGSADENSALIAEHLDAAGDLRDAYDWRLRAAAWSSPRDIRAARLNWERARWISDAIPGSDLQRTALRIAPRTMLSMSTWRVGGSLADTGFDDLRKLCESVGDDLSLAVAMYGQIALLSFQHRYHEASLLASEQFDLLQKSPDAVTALGLIHGAVMAKLHAGDPLQACHVAQWAIEMIEVAVGEDTAEAAGSSLAMMLLWGAVASCSVGNPGWRHDMRRAIDLERTLAPEGSLLLFLIGVGYGFLTHMEALVPDERAMEELSEAVRRAEEIGDDLALGTAYLARGLVLSRRSADAERRLGLEALRSAHEIFVQRAILTPATMAEIQIAEMTAVYGDVQQAIEDARSIVNQLVENDEGFMRAAATAVLVQSLIQRGSDADLVDAADEIERLAAIPTDPGFVLNEIQLLANARPVGPRLRRRRRIPGLRGPLSRHGEIAWLRRAHGDRRGDALAREHQRALDLLDRLRHLDPTRAGLRAVERGAAAPHAVDLVEDVEALGGGFVAAVEDEPVGVDDRGRPEVAALAPVDGAAGGAARAQDALGGVVVAGAVGRALDPLPGRRVAAGRPGTA